MIPEAKRVMPKLFVRENKITAVIRNLWVSVKYRMKDSWHPLLPNQPSFSLPEQTRAIFPLLLESKHWLHSLERFLLNLSHQAFFLYPASCVLFLFNIGVQIVAITWLFHKPSDGFFCSSVDTKTWTNFEKKNQKKKTSGSFPYLSFSYPLFISALSSFLLWCQMEIFMVVTCWVKYHPLQLKYSLFSVCKYLLLRFLLFMLKKEHYFSQIWLIQFSFNISIALGYFTKHVTTSYCVGKCEEHTG